MTTQAQTHTFEAEVEEVLSLVVHSLYSQRDIFLRELISNASDALDRLRFEALTEASLMDDGESLGIALEVDVEARELRIADNGIGMTDEEIVSNLGSIASSGTRRFLEGLRERGAEQAPELIGQFGVGFYSAFIVADRVTVETRKAGEASGWRWVSDGAREYTLEAADDLARGTVVTLHMRETDEEEDDLLAEWKLREIVKRYSDFVEYPIQMEVE
ncbi:MAG: ATP-binding protein, partial [Planctomycetota bacterium]